MPPPRANILKKGLQKSKFRNPNSATRISSLARHGAAPSRSPQTKIHHHHTQYTLHTNSHFSVSRMIKKSPRTTEFPLTLAIATELSLPHYYVFFITSHLLPKHDNATRSKSSSKRTKQTFGQQVAVTAELTAHCLVQTLWERLHSLLDGEVEFLEDSLNFVGDASFFLAKKLDDAANWMAKQKWFQKIAKSKKVQKFVAFVNKVRGE